MKRLLLPLLAAATLLFSGCATTPLTDDVAAIANLATYTAVTIDLEDNPDRRPAYALALAALDGLVRDENYSPANLSAALKQLPVTELSGRKGTLIVGGAVVLYTRALQRVDIDKVALAKSVTLAVRDGLRGALSQ